ncbi:MAG: hypothetical protein GXP58_09445 [Deltaproteobacteria bacterium]|nr:hypothetical protein [Deltaproteobacteria bacterium]
MYLNRAGNQKGMALIVALLLLVALSAVALSLMFSSTFENTIAANDKKNTIAFQNAETGIEMARNVLLNFRDRDEGFTKLLSIIPSSADPVVLDLENVGINSGDPVYSVGANVYNLDTTRYTVTIWDDSNDPLETDNNDRVDSNFSVMVRSVGKDPTGNAAKTITTKLRYGDAREFAQGKQDANSGSSKDQKVETEAGNGRSTSTFDPSTT